ncbi:unnamed protein product, partial [Ectocarpus sp. 12 AP-2014]
MLTQAGMASWSIPAKTHPTSPLLLFVHTRSSLETHPTSPLLRFVHTRSSLVTNITLRFHVEQSGARDKEQTRGTCNSYGWPEYRVVLTFLPVIHVCLLVGLAALLGGAVVVGATGRAGVLDGDVAVGAR